MYIRNYIIINIKLLYNKNRIEDLIEIFIHKIILKIILNSKWNKLIYFYFQIFFFMIMKYFSQNNFYNLSQ